MSVATAPDPKPDQLPEIRYRLKGDGKDWSVLWRMNMTWIRVYGPTTEGAAREHLGLLIGMTL